MENKIYIITQASSYFSSVGLIRILIILMSITGLQCNLLDNSVQGQYFSEEPPKKTPVFSLNLIGTPEGVNSSTSLDIKIQGSALLRYKYKIGYSAQLDCSDNEDYSLAISHDVPLTNDLSLFSDRYISICIIGQNINGEWQSNSDALRKTWGKDTGQPQEVHFTKSSQSVNESDQTASFTVNIAGPKMTDTRVFFSVGGSSLYNQDHSLASGSVIIPSGSLSTKVNYILIDNGVQTIDKEIYIGLTEVIGDNIGVGLPYIQHTIIRDDEALPQPLYSNLKLSSQTTCVIVESSGILKCWGINDYGQLGDGTTIDRMVPAVIDSGTPFSSISPGREHTCGILKTTSKLSCWGRNHLGQLGDGTTMDRLNPTPIDSANSYSSVAVGLYHTCGILVGSGFLKCWGWNLPGHLGDGTNTDSLTPIPIDSGTSYLQIQLGFSHSCALTTDLEVKCWGANEYGQLGGGTVSMFGPSTPTIVSGGKLFSKISVGGYTTCGITSISSQLMCWGKGTYGVLGDGSTSTLSLPTLIDSGVSYDHIVTEGEHACGITKDIGLLKCWGKNILGQVGDGTTIDKLVPTLIDPGTSYGVVALGNKMTCGLTLNTGSIKCWGANNNGQFGNGDTYDQTLPIKINLGISFSKITLGNSSTCSITSLNNKLKCWGGNYYGQLGVGSQVSQYAPLTIDLGISYSNIFAGHRHTCGITSLGRDLKCWGHNSGGQIGDGTTLNKTLPTLIDPGTFYSTISLGQYHSCGIIESNKEVKCWAYNLLGQLGNGTVNDALTPTLIDGGSAYTDISLGSSHSCAIVDVTGELRCWGANNYGGLGDGTTTEKSIPAVIDSGVAYSQVALGSGSSCGLVRLSGELRCWGWNLKGELGDGTTQQRWTPVIIDPPTSYSYIAMGRSHTCAITTATGELRCTGGNENGQLGDGTRIDKSNFVVIDSGTSYSSVSLGQYHTCGVTTATGEIKCWGSKTNGRIGDAGVTYQPSYVIGM